MHISTSPNVFGGSCADAAPSLLPRCFLFSERSSEENKLWCRAAGSNQTTETLLLPALKKAAEHHSNNPRFRPRFTLLLHYTARISCAHRLHRFLPEWVERLKLLLFSMTLGILWLFMKLLIRTKCASRPGLLNSLTNGDR